jgi:ketosteroid isomerase-like protein
VDRSRVERFVRSWAEDWNNHDLDGVLSHFSEDVIFTSPVAAHLVPETGGVLRGKVALRGYWEEGLRRIPALHFEILHVYSGVNTVVINYRNQTGALVSEILVFDGDVVVEGHGTYDHDDNPAGATDATDRPPR